MPARSVVSCASEMNQGGSESGLQIRVEVSRAEALSIASDAEHVIVMHTGNRRMWKALRRAREDVGRDRVRR
jgi:hypothetical protein